MRLRELRQMTIRNVFGRLHPAGKLGRIDIVSQKNKPEIVRRFQS